MKDCTVLAGHRGLDRIVQFVNISDTPDTIQFLDTHYLLLTTAFGFKDTPKLCELIQQMHQLNCSGMIIKINRFLGSLPEEAKRLADELALPIINLPMEYMLGDVSRHILNFLNNDKSEQLNFALHVHKKFSDMFVKGYDTNSLVIQLGYFLKRPILLLNHRGEVLASTHDFRKETMKVAEKEAMQKIKDSLSAARQGMTFDMTAKGFETISTFTVQTKSQQSSMLVIFDALTLSYPASEIAIQQACNVISFVLIKEQAIHENSRLLKNNFFADLIDKRIRSEEEIIARCKYYGLQANLESICIVCCMDSLAPNHYEYHSVPFHEKKFEELHNSIYDQIEDEMIHTGLKGTIFTKEKYFVMLMQFPVYTEKTGEEVRRFISHVQGHHQSDVTISFGISNQIQSLTEVPTAYQEAVEALTNGYDQEMTGFIQFYKTREIKELLSLLPKQKLKELYENTLKSLAYPKTKEDGELLKTMKVHLDSQCAISETSRKLLIHRNTVKYRIEKTEFLLHCSFQDPSDTLRIRVALLIGSILHKDHDKVH